jgi:hypothetical protein
VDDFSLCSDWEALPSEIKYCIAAFVLNNRHPFHSLTKGTGISIMKENNIKS